MIYKVTYRFQDTSKMYITCAESCLEAEQNVWDYLTRYGNTGAGTVSATPLVFNLERGEVIEGWEES